MLLINKKQMKALEIAFADEFVCRMQKSLEVNSSLAEYQSHQDLKDLIKKIKEQYHISKEQNIEDFLLMNFEFPQLFSSPSPKLNRLLLHRVKKEDMKIRELKDMIITL